MDLLPDVDPTPERRFDGARVLVVDDKLNLLFLLGRALRVHGLTVTLAADAASALAAMDDADDDFDIVLTDFDMPGMHGDRLLWSIRSRGDGDNGIPRLVLMSGALPAKLDLPPGTLRLSKPFSVQTLLRELARTPPAPDGDDG